MKNDLRFRFILIGTSAFIVIAVRAFVMAVK